MASSPLPPLQAGWMSHVVAGPLPAETHATCDRCAMCTAVPPGAESFNPQTKCCTYLPVLPNFLVGAVLGDGDPAAEPGRASVRARIASGAAVTPLGLGVPPGYELLYAHGGARVFGQARSMRCPHYLEDGGRCGIWRHRNAVCATWFCKHDRGAAGFEFWSRVRELLTAVEGQLARACLVELEVDAAALTRTLPGSRFPGLEPYPVSAAELDGRRDAAAAAASWGSWAGREEEFYRACAGFVEGLAFDDVVRRCGPEVQLRWKVVQAAYARLRSATPPSRPRLGALTIVGADRETCRVTTYSPHDPLELPRSLVDALPHFDGRPLDAALAEIAAGGGPRLTPGAVRKLADFAILVEAAGDR